MLLLKAYGLGDEHLSGPGWLDTERYTINARVPAGTSNTQFELMLQRLLTGRFRLEVHHESRRQTAYELMVRPGGMRMARAAPPSIDLAANGGDAPEPQGISLLMPVDALPWLQASARSWVDGTTESAAIRLLIVR
jgi:uncharacterized protein (TIGR03435 family)